jgi:hypothetical protein
VTGLYRDLLHRAPDMAGLSHWMQMIQMGASDQQVATDIWRSAEHRGDEVDAFYAQFLGRAADASGRANWVNQLMSGMVDELGLMVDLLASREYVVTHNSPAAFVNGAFTTVLGRMPNMTEQAFWMNMLQMQGPANVARGIATSMESDTRIVDSYYQSFLGRGPDASGLNHWVMQLQTGRGTLESVAEGFLGSVEYARKNLTTWRVTNAPE